MRSIHKLLIVVGIALLVFLSLLVFRELAPSEIDDISPGIPCSAQRNLVMQTKTLWVIPDFKGVPISNNKTWCREILALNKTLGLHGVVHSYNEFGTDRNQSYLDKGIKIFEACFGSRPTEFKAPQLNISAKNKVLILKNNMVLRGWLNQVTHKVYHCNDSGKFSNRFIGWV